MSFDPLTTTGVRSIDIVNKLEDLKKEVFTHALTKARMEVEERPIINKAFDRASEMCMQLYTEFEQKIRQEYTDTQDSTTLYLFLNNKKSEFNTTLRNQIWHILKVKEPPKKSFFGSFYKKV